jgi:hypothetical protein
MDVNPWVFYGCCRGCNRTPTVAGPLNGLGFCHECECSFEQYARDNQTEPYHDEAAQYRSPRPDW